MELRAVDEWMTPLISGDGRLRLLASVLTLKADILNIISAYVIKALFSDFAR